MTAPIDTGPAVTLVANIKTTAGQSFAASSLFTASDPFGDAIAQYDFWDTGASGGHFALNGQTLGASQENIVSAAQLASTTYVSGPGTDTLWVRVNEGGQWSAWSPSFTVSDPTTIGAGETLELTSASSDAITFTADTGTLKLDNPSSFAGSVAGMSGEDTIDLADIDASKVQTLSYSGDASGGTLRVTDGVHAARIALLGNYLASSFRHVERRPRRDHGERPGSGWRHHPARRASACMRVRRVSHQSAVPTCGLINAPLSRRRIDVISGAAYSACSLSPSAGRGSCAASVATFVHQFHRDTLYRRSIFALSAARVPDAARASAYTKRSTTVKVRMREAVRR